MKRILLLLALLPIGCSQPNQESSVAALESGLTAADILALQYTSLPVCPTGAPVCADPTIKNSIKTAAQTAYTTIKQAEASAASGQSVDLTAATAALAALQALVQANLVTAAVAPATKGTK